MTTNNVVSDQHSVVIQNQSSGQLDFLWLNASANLIGSALGPVVPRVVGSGAFFGPDGVPTGQVGNTIVSQLANGQLDFLGFNGHGGLIASDLVANTVGL